MTDNFWQQKSLFEMNHEEWESICDGCAKCCLQQLEDDTTGELVFTDVACDLLQSDQCRCSDYENRSTLVPECMTMTSENVTECAEFAPQSCAYRLLLEGKELPAWHHLHSGSRDTIHEAGHSVRGRTRFAREVNLEELENYVVDWP
ncbi:MAG: YcgN family cysteine cluster protein [Pseudomonadota bacterium]